MLPVAEALLTLAGEDLGDRHACLLLDIRVHVDEPPARLARDVLADGRFSAAHEAAEDNIVHSHSLFFSLLDYFISSAAASRQSLSISALSYCEPSQC